MSEPIEATARDGDRHLAVLDASPNAIIGVTDTGRIVYANDQVRACFGYEPAALIGVPVEQLLPDHLRTRHKERRTGFFAHPVARPMGAGLELTARRVDGTTLPVEISLTPVDGPEGRVTYATVVDVSARVAAAADLEERDRRVRSILEASPNVIVAVDRTGTIRFANARIQTVFGYAPDDVIGGPIERLLPERVASGHVALRERFMARPRARPMGIGMDLAGRRDDGSEFPVEISLAPVTTSDGLLVYASIVDITERKSVEAQLLQAQKLESVGRLAGGIAHDFNNVLFAIRGYSELIVEDLDGDPTRLDLADLRERVNAIAGAAERASTLTAQLLSFSRRQRLSPKVIDVATAIRAMAPMLQPLIGEHIRLTMRLDEHAGAIRIDPGQLDQMLANLAINARDAMPDGGQLAIQTEVIDLDDDDLTIRPEMGPGRYVVITVSDTGIGMDAETRAHAFEPFYTTKEAGKGTGLGLASIYGIVRQSGGHVWLYSEPGLGTTCKLYLPQVTEAADVATPVAVADQSPGRALVVEDDPMVRDLTAQVLTRAGFEVTTVTDAASALRVVGVAAPFDVIVSDVIMPGMSGLQLAERLLADDPNVGLVLMSGYSEELLELGATQAARLRFISKPVSARQLLEAVRTARRGAS